MLPDALLNDPDLIAFWDFREEGPHHRSRGPFSLTLIEQHGPMARDAEGIGGEPSLRIAHPQWLRIPRAEIGPLDIHGRQPFTLVAWLRRDSDRPWQFVAGVWNERDHRRQYALFLNATKCYDHVRNERRPCADLVHGYVSATGGHTPGHPACFSYATSPVPVPVGRWACVGLSYDGRAVSVWVDGRCEPWPHFNPMPFADEIYDGGSDGADFTVAQRAMALWRDYPHSPMPVDEGFSGWLAGVAVWRRTLTESEHDALARRAPHP